MAMRLRISWLWVTLATSSLFDALEAKTSPLSVTPSSKWYGDAGTWSAVSIKLGTPAQELDVWVNTRNPQIGVVGSDACSTDACRQARGGTFNAAASKSWNLQGTTQTALGSNDYSAFGFDTLTYASTSVQNTIVEEYNTTINWLGYFGVGITSSTSNAGSTVLSPISQLVETESEIPSHSYAYTAGAAYRNTAGCPTSLTLGGLDTNRFADNGIIFTLNQQNDLAVGVNSISLSLAANNSILPSNWQSPTPNMVDQNQVFSAVIDSRTPYLWLPEAVCDNFASALNLTYNSTVDLYTFDGNPSQHANLQALNFTISFELAQQSPNGGSATINFPYVAFDQQMTFPYTTFYFPIKRSLNTTQYTLGRTFLQEAYIIVDYERGNFSVHQALFPQDASTNFGGVVAITRPPGSTFTGPNSSQSHSISKGAIAGLVIGVLALLILLALALYYRIKYNRLKAQQHHRHQRLGSEASISPFFGKFRFPGHRSPPTKSPTEGNGNNFSRSNIGLPTLVEPVELDSNNIEAPPSFKSMNIIRLSEYDRERMRREGGVEQGNSHAAPRALERVDTGHGGGGNKSQRSSFTVGDDLSPTSLYRVMGEQFSPITPTSPEHLLQSYAPSSTSYNQTHTNSSSPYATNTLPDGTIIPNIPSVEPGFLPDLRAELERFRGGRTHRDSESNFRDTLGSNYTVEETERIQKVMREQERERQRSRNASMERERQLSRDEAAMTSVGGVARDLEDQGLVASSHQPSQRSSNRFSWQE